MISHMVLLYNRTDRLENFLSLGEKEEREEAWVAGSWSILRQTSVRTTGWGAEQALRHVEIVKLKSEPALIGRKV